MLSGRRNRAIRWVDWRSPKRLFASAAFLGLPVRARLLVIDPGQEHAVTVDLASRADAPPLTGELPPVAIHVHVTADGAIKTGLPDDINDDLRKSEDGR